MVPKYKGVLSCLWGVLAENLCLSVPFNVVVIEACSKSEQCMSWLQLLPSTFNLGAFPGGNVCNVCLCSIPAQAGSNTSKYSVLPSSGEFPLLPSVTVHHDRNINCFCVVSMQMLFLFHCTCEAQANKYSQVFSFTPY